MMTPIEYLREELEAVCAAAEKYAGGLVTTGRIKEALNFSLIGHPEQQMKPLTEQRIHDLARSLGWAIHIGGIGADAVELVRAAERDLGIGAE